MFQRVQVFCAKFAPQHLLSKRFQFHSQVLAGVQATRYETLPHFIAYRDGYSNIGVNADNTFLNTNVFGNLNINRGFCNNSNFSTTTNWDLNNLFCIHLNGMPYSCKEIDVMKFFSPLKPVHCKVINGLHTGGAIAYFQSHEEAEEAMKRNKKNMGNRYIDLFYDNPSTRSSNFDGDNTGNNKWDLNNLFCVCLKGMPFKCDETDILKFFSPLKPVYCKVVFNKKGLPSGGGIAYFQSHEEAEEAMKHHKDNMGDRYIDLFYDNRSTSNNNFGGDSNSDNSNNNDETNNLFRIRLRGMPYSCGETDIMKFFSPLKPVQCEIVLNEKGLCSGAGNAYFQSREEAKEAMKFNRDYMADRYIELRYG